MKCQITGGHGLMDDALTCSTCGKSKYPEVFTTCPRGHRLPDWPARTDETFTWQPPERQKFNLFRWFRST